MYKVAFCFRKWHIRAFCSWGSIDLESIDLVCLENGILFCVMAHEGLFAIRAIGWYKVAFAQGHGTSGAIAHGGPLTCEVY